MHVYDVTIQRRGYSHPNVCRIRHIDIKACVGLDYCNLCAHLLCILMWISSHQYKSVRWIRLQIRMSLVTNMNKSCPSYDGSNMNESRLKYEWVTSHVWRLANLIQRTHLYHVTIQLWATDAIHIQKRSECSHILCSSKLTASMWRHDSTASTDDIYIQSWSSYVLIALI